jgi:hypothetical protein
MMNRGVELPASGFVLRVLHREQPEQEMFRGVLSKAPAKPCINAFCVFNPLWRAVRSEPGVDSSQRGLRVRKTIPV